MSDSISVAMLIECFKDHWAFTNIDKDDTLAFDLMFDEMFIFSIDRGPKAVVLDNGEHFEEHEASFDGSDIDEEKKTVEFRERKVCIPYLMILGLLYCKSNKE